MNEIQALILARLASSRSRFTSSLRPRRLRMMTKRPKLKTGAVIKYNTMHRPDPEVFCIPNCTHIAFFLRQSTCLHPTPALNSPCSRTYPPSPLGFQLTSCTFGHLPSPSHALPPHPAFGVPYEDAEDADNDKNDEDDGVFRLRCYSPPLSSLPYWPPLASPPNEDAGKDEKAEDDEADADDVDDDLDDVAVSTTATSSSRPWTSHITFFHPLAGTHRVRVSHIAHIICLSWRRLHDYFDQVHGLPHHVPKTLILPRRHSHLPLPPPHIPALRGLICVVFFLIKPAWISSTSTYAAKAASISPMNMVFGRPHLFCSVIDADLFLPLAGVKYDSSSIFKTASSTVM
ncbi:hypothetical protein R3P38DRAFT_2803417 [Favolaschia claudopus]|uniref:Uncharacterized protein n=1 Tax=Favolaschia claudopus TaxID=2862362 RepID=A0AAV9ZN46_9AGAR